MIFNFSTKKRILVLLTMGFLFCFLLPLSFTADRTAKNVILMISDGQGFNSVRAADFYAGHKAVYEGFEHKYAMQTNSAGERDKHAGEAYSPTSMAKNFDYAKAHPTDSSSSATAMFSGVKIYDHEVNFTPGNVSIETFFEKAAKKGVSIGAVSTVPVTHATPAAVYAHNRSRMDYAAMAREAIYGSHPIANNANYAARNYNGFLKVVMGAGHPLYDNNARERKAAKYDYVGGEESWKALSGGVNGWTLITKKEQFEKLAKGRTPDKVFGIPQVADTLQGYRSGMGGLNNKALPYASPANTGVPDLAVMVRAALNVLDNNKKGFALMIEGGAVDWANHSNLAGRMIEEQMDFNKAVNAVVEYLDRNTNGNNFDNTLLIVTADHECGYLWGDGRVAGSTFFDVNKNGRFDHGVDYAHVKDNGAGKLPDVWYHSIGHSNSLVPLHAKGPGSRLFDKCVIGMEPNLRAIYDLDASWTGRYIDNTCIYRIMAGALLGTAAIP